MRKISVVGIGSGDPEHITVQAISTLNTVDVVFMVDKGDEKRELTDLRREICERYITAPRLPGRDRGRDTARPGGGRLPGGRR